MRTFKGLSVAIIALFSVYIGYNIIPTEEVQARTLVTPSLLEVPFQPKESSISEIETTPEIDVVVDLSTKEVSVKGTIDTKVNVTTVNEPKPETVVKWKTKIKQVQDQLTLEHVLIDAMPLELDIPSTSIIKGDAKSISIAAASVLAKVTRDRMMIELDQKYPMYGFASHKGYPTKKHIEAIHQYGLIDGYRKTYGPIKEMVGEK